ncbi:post-GPI attachment to proteins factor 3 [Onthophagus taurus]|uniref:post-GPI attachment to proteins factor 3 n=1 Tax=Onthophagus taurus TaxID=166361 RepID=UPI000C20DFEC|nr:post-GPI attachment to proteins factor 3 [Onthophagus taurus]
MRRVLLLIILFNVKITFGSVGNASPYFKRCSYDCTRINCTLDGSKYKTNNLQNFFYTLTYWRCENECEYMCMWDTVDLFQKRQYRIPQFYGKWPFIKILTIQEPASTIFSLINLYAHIKMAKRMKEEIRFGSPNLWLWYGHAILFSHSWIWSAIFHARDTELTEFMDYVCAYSTILYSFYTMLMRTLYNSSKKLLVIVTALCLSFYASHATYIYTGRFDYGYNMQVNVFTGVLAVVGWLSFWQLNKKQIYTRKIALYSVYIAVMTLLELIDAPPLLWTFDSHAIWHASTIPATYIVYSFAIDDCKYLRKQMEFSRKDSF